MDKLPMLRPAILISIFGLLGFGIEAWGCRTIKPMEQQFFYKLPHIPTVDLGAYRSVQGRPYQDSSLAVSLALSGGGARAYGFAMGVMLGLEQLADERYPNLLEEVDYWSCTSGGGFSAAIYFALRHRIQQQYPDSQVNLAGVYDSLIRPILLTSYASPAIYGRLSPRSWFGPIDDGDYLEKRIEQKILRPILGQDTASLTLGAFWVDRYAAIPVRHPWPMFNSTTYRGMVVFPFAPNVLATYQISGYTHLLKKHFADTLINPYHFPVALAIKSSGTFPGLITNTTLKSQADPDRPFLDLFDGGVADNQSWRTAMAVLGQESPSRRKALWLVDVDHSPYAKAFKKREGAPFFLSTLARTPISGLEHRRTLRDTYVGDYARMHGVEAVALDFGVLVNDNSAPIPQAFKPKTTRLALLKKLKTDFHLLDGADRHKLFALLVRIRTKYTIKPWELDLLVYAGQYIVWLQRHKLIASITPGA